MTQTSGTKTNDSLLSAALLEDFRDIHMEWGSTRGAFGMCVNASRLFAQFLIGKYVIAPHYRGTNWDFVSFHLDRYRACCKIWPVPDEYPFITSPDEEHHVLRVNEYCYDWTARQYNEDLPFPFVFKVTA